MAHDHHPGARAGHAAHGPDAGPDRPEPEPGRLELDGLYLPSVTPERFARIVRATPRGRAAEVMAGPHRRRILEELFARMPALFRAEAAGGREALVRWQVTTPAGGPDTFETEIAAGLLAVTGHATGRVPRLTLTMAGPELLRLAAGTASGPWLLVTRRLRADGDLLLAAALTGWFDLPTG